MLAGATHPDHDHLAALAPDISKPVLGLAVSFVTVAEGIDPRAVWMFNREAGALTVIAGTGWLYLLGFTVSGYVLVLWPVAFVNHILIWRWTNLRNQSDNPSLSAM